MKHKKDKSLAASVPAGSEIPERGKDRAQQVPNVETIELLRNITTEINCGKVMFPKSEAEMAHNNACQRAMDIIDNYKQGYGLFQMTRGMK